MELALISETLDLEARPASWNVPRPGGPTPSWIAPAKTEALPSVHPTISVRVPLDLLREEIFTPEVHEKRDAEELERLSTEIEQLRGDLASAAATVARMRVDILRDSEPELVRLAMTIAERVVQNEVTTAPRMVLDWAREGLEGLGNKPAASITVSSDVASAFNDDDRALLGAQITVDEALPSGSCIVRAEDSRLDVSASSRLRSVAEALEAPGDMT